MQSPVQEKCGYSEYIPSPFNQLGLPIGRREKKTYTAEDGNIYNTNTDDHAKHWITDEQFKSRYQSNKRKFAKDLKDKEIPAKFFPLTVEEYQFRVEACVKKLADERVINPDAPPFIQFAKDIGADDGETTDWVEVYHTPGLGTHIRPISYTNMKKATKNRNPL